MNRNWTAGRRRVWRYAALFCLALPAGLAGCGGNLAPVTGKVTYAGKPVTGGMLFFSPVGTELNPGRPATAEVQPDGTYTLGTNGTADGVLPGRHRIRYSPPAQQLSEAQRRDRNYTPPPPPYVGLMPKQGEVEVTPQTETIDIELVPALKR
jgi:hypothetical protein